MMKSIAFAAALTVAAVAAAEAACPATSASRTGTWDVRFVRGAYGYNCRDLVIDSTGKAAGACTVSNGEGTFQVITTSAFNVNTTTCRIDGARFRLSAGPQSDIEYAGRFTMNLGLDEFSGYAHAMDHSHAIPMTFTKK